MLYVETTLTVGCSSIITSILYNKYGDEQITDLYYQSRLLYMRNLLEGCLSLLAILKRVVNVSSYIITSYHSLRILRLIGRCSFVTFADGVLNSSQ
jgi:hypothetical protein